MPPAQDLLALVDACRTSPVTLAPGLVMAAAVALAVIALGAWVDRRTRFPGQLTFRWLRIATIAWLFVQGIEAATVAPACKLLWAMNAWPAILATAILWALFLRRYALGDDRPLARGAAMALAAVPLAAWLVALANPWHGLLYGADSALGTAGGPVRYARGPAFWVMVSCGYAAMGAGVLAVARAAWAAQGPMRRLMLSLLGITLIPWLANAIYLGSGLTLFGQDPTARSLALAVLLSAWAMRHGGLFDLAPIARTTLLDALSDPVLVVDRAARVVDANPAAQRLSGARATGQSIVEWSMACPALASAIAESAEGAELQLRGRVYEMSCVPLVGRDLRLGSLVHLRDVTERHRAQIRLADALARRDETVEAVTRLHAQLREQALRDPLTGLQNRRGLEESFDRDRHAAATAPTAALCVAVVDVDHFKRVNDTFGHAVGDEVLQGMARRLQSAGLGDAFRLGGEEFVLLMPRLSIEEAIDRAEALRLEVRARPFDSSAGPRSCTVSIGVAAWRRDGDSLTELIRMADAALYRAKAAGRDRVEAASLSQGQQDLLFGLAMDDPPTVAAWAPSQQLQRAS